jgi:transcriptional regulator with PAS, ATPase and Fis domain
MLAQAIHQASAQQNAPFVGINVAAIPRELVESELFGHERGAFTGARSGGSPGKFELAERGTLLLDEIGDMPLEMQAKLLRVLQERIVQRLGGTRDISIYARVIATTHRDLERAVEEGSFRLDLFHRLRAVHVRLPALRDRRGDIPALVEQQLRRYAERLGRAPLAIAPPVMDALLAYHWPGYVRELANLVEGEASLLPAGKSVLERVPPALRGQRRAAVGPSFPPGVMPLAELERLACEKALAEFGGNVAKAARALGVAKNTLYAKARRFGLLEPGQVTHSGGTVGAGAPSVKD